MTNITTIAPILEIDLLPWTAELAVEATGPVFRWVCAGEWTPVVAIQVADDSPGGRVTYVTVDGRAYGGSVFSRLVPFDLATEQPKLSPAEMFQRWVPQPVESVVGLYSLRVARRDEACEYL